MLRVHCLQLCYNLSDPTLEDLLYEAESVRRFCGLNLSGPLPDESTILHFRHLLERHQLGEAHRLLRGGEREAWGDAGYQGAERRPELADSEVEWRVAMRPGRRRALPPDSPLARRERQRASLRAKVDHPFLFIKRRFGYDKVRYRGLAKNHQRLALLLGFANLLIAESQLA